MPVTIHLLLNETNPFAVGTHIGIEDMRRSQGNCPLSWRNNANKYPCEKPQLTLLTSAELGGARCQ